MLIRPASGLPLLDPLRSSLRERLGVPCFLRRSAAEDALLVTDALRRAADRPAMLARLNQSGDWCFHEDHGLLQLDPSPALWRQLMAGAPACEPAEPREGQAFPCLRSCALRLITETVDPALQPVAPLRLAFKRLEAGEPGRLEEELPRAVALLQRRREPLPEAAGRYVWAFLNELEKERERCC